MPTISYDGQSFFLDGRRIWLVSGAIHYTRTPRDLWRRRIRAARQAGLNCVETYVFWNVHEPQPGVFNFEGDADLRHFVELIAAEGMFCILRPGPYICADWDFGGLPAWLLRPPAGRNGQTPLKLRQANGPFLEACARYLGAVMDQVRDLQVNAAAPGRASEVAPGGGGPIVLIQTENEWISYNPQQADTYLGELVRYLRESGCTVPISVCNNLWQRVEGAIDTWNANEHLAADLRQLGVVQPNAPRLVSEFWPGWFDRWGAEHHTAFDADWSLDRLAQILAVGAQYNLYMFHGGTNFGFYGGRSVASPDCFITTSYDYDAPLREAGGRGAKYRAVKRISTFASQFGQLFAHLDAHDCHAAIAPGEGAPGLSVIGQRGAQGQVVFILRSGGERASETRVLLPNGLTLPVSLGQDRVAWFVFDANLGGVAHLSYTNLRPWAFVEREMLVLFGPAGAQGHIAINDAPWTVRVPSGHEPLVERHEGLTVVVLNHQQVDAAFIAPGRLVIGAAGLDEQDGPRPLAGWPAITAISVSGEAKTAALKPAPRPTSPRLVGWKRADTREYLDGRAAAYRPLDGPQSLEELGNNLGYGWYHLAIKGGRSARALAPQAGDRLHLFAAGQPQAVLGLGPGAEYDPVDLRLTDGVTVLADNLGRFNFGWHLGERKGLFGHIYEVKPVRLGRPQVVAGRAPDPFELTPFVLYARKGERPPADALVWKLKLTGRRSLILDIQGLPARAMVVVNGQGVGLYHPTYTAGLGRFLLRHGEQLRAGRNELRLALFEPAEKGLDPLRFVRLYEATANLTENAQWSFAPWSVPPRDAFAGALRSGNRPTWYRGEFRVKAAQVPLWLEPAGMSKGQIFLNGRNVGRYFVATATGKAVPPQKRYYLPEPWLRTDGPNELILFDEHGKSPAKCRLIYDPMGPYGE